MGACFLVTWSDGEPDLALHERAARWLPFVPEHTSRQPILDGLMSVWSVYGEAARGSYVAADARGVLAYHGWWAEPAAAPTDRSVAEVLLDQVSHLGFDAALSDLDGDGVLAFVDASGAFRAGTDFLGASHLYFGQRGRVTAVSNRAFLVAAALHEGTLPGFDARELAWLVSGPGAPVGDQTAFEGVALLGPYQTLARPGRDTAAHLRVLATQRRDRPQADPRPRWDDLFGDLKRRAGQIGRLADARFALTLTGGKDSRAVLAGLVGAGVVHRVTQNYLESEPAHPDAVAAGHLCAHYGLPQAYRKTVMETLPWRESQARHNFQVELVFNAYDRKGWRDVPRESTLGGNYGEIFKSHARLSLALGPAEARRFYTRGPWLNRWGLLARPARNYLRGRMEAWLDGVLADGTPSMAIHDRWHRECRMHRWVGQAMQADGAAILWMHPLPGRRLLSRYLALPLAEREAHRVHFELIRRCDDWLWRQPFCQQRWSAWLTTEHLRPGRCVDGPTTAIEPAAQTWAQSGREVAAFLREREDDGLLELIDATALAALLRRMERRQSNRDLTSVFGIAGIRAALRGIDVLPMAMVAK
ncbi:MAG: hypothetical protein FJ100_20790 [Deltaproteobacteria bacterium]|nr:hypothetical protein [Deltaproteobacteria bacterium]